MRYHSVSAVLAAALGASLSQAQFLINELSFGYQDRISPPESPGRIPNFVVDGKPNQPEVLSNKLVLTPVYPGNQRGSVWAEKPLTITTWVADVDFRVSGAERGGGNLNIWLVNGGVRDVGSSSIFTVGKFDGLALVVDMHGGSGGMIRGFLNDGSQDYSQHHQVDELAFGHCLYSYRNLGRPSQIKMRQNGRVFKVEIDGRLCFETDKFQLPPGYQFGISAATPDNPDSFEIFKLVVMSETAQGSWNGNTPQGQGQQQQQAQQTQQQEKPKQKKKPASQARGERDDAAYFQVEDNDEDADTFETSMAQFRDLHTRLQATNHQIGAVFRAVNKQAGENVQQSLELKELVNGLSARLSKLDQVDELQRRVKALEQEIRGMRNDLGKKIQAQERSVKGALTDHHATMSQTIIDSMPRHRTLLLLFLGFQVVVVVGYVVYKRRKSQSSKKYL